MERLIIATTHIFFNIDLNTIKYQIVGLIASDEETKLTIKRTPINWGDLAKHYIDQVANTQTQLGLPYPTITNQFRIFFGVRRYFW